MQTSERSESHGKGGTDRVVCMYGFSGLELFSAALGKRKRKQKHLRVFLSQRSGGSGHGSTLGDCGAEPGLPGRLFFGVSLWVSAEGSRREG